MIELLHNILLYAQTPINPLKHILMYFIYSMNSAYYMHDYRLDYNVRNHFAKTSVHECTTAQETVKEVLIIKLLHNLLHTMVHSHPDICI